MSVHISNDEKQSLRVKYLRQFRRDEDGTIIILTLLLLVIMLVMGGIAVDLMRFEERRVVLQNVSDRAVLAAAELDQTVDSEEIIDGYFKSENLLDTIVRKEIKDNPGDRAMEVEAKLDLNTFYMRLIGIDTLTAPAISTAREGTGNIEISLVLDISGSMDDVVSQPEGPDGRRIDLLKDAATEFVNDLLIPEYRDEISISLVMYSTQVNIGDSLFSAINTTPDTILADDTLVDWDDIPDSLKNDEAWLALNQPIQNVSRCIEFRPEHFATTAFDVAHQYRQYARLDWRSNSSTSDFARPECPEPNEEGFVPSIVPLTQNAGLLTSVIDQLEPTYTTSIHLGMKWGAALLDPSMRGLLANVAEVDPAFRGVRPAEFGNSGGVNGTTKYLIIMTDGNNVSGRRIRDSYYDQPYWRRAFSSFPVRYFLEENEGNHPGGQNPTRDQIVERPDSDAQYDTWLQQTCDSARSDADNPEKIIVITISMGAPAGGAQQMRDCAYTTNYFYQSDQSAIGEVFAAIAKQITDLRLTQ